jgi:hypothetical protein
MSTLLAASHHIASRATLSFERQDINFYSPRPDQVVVSVALRNERSVPTGPTSVRFETAPLGAFVRWQPLAYALVPAIAGGQTHLVRFVIPRSRNAPLGRHPGGIPPARLLTALGMGEPPRRGPRLVGVSDGDSETMAFQTGALPADPFELLGHANPHWAGNLNVFVGERAVERHLAQGLRVYQGRVNTAFFMVGSGRDAYAFELAGAGAHWDAALYHTLARGTLGQLMLHLDEIDRVDDREWVEIERQAFLLLAVRPPNGCGLGSLEVHVTQRSTGRTALVEFSLDPGFAGPGCFVVT